VIGSKGGDATSKDKKNEKFWTIFWQTGEVTISSSGGGRLQTGLLHGVRGEIYKKNSVVCRYKADNGTADDATRILVLTDHVQIDSVSPHLTLTCDKVVYEGNKKFFKATGHVQVLGTMGTMGTLDEVWATSDLTKIASPSLFNQP